MLELILVRDPPNDTDLIEVADRIGAKLSNDTELIKFGYVLLDDEDLMRGIKRDFISKGLRELCIQILEKWRCIRDKPTWYEVVAALKSDKIKQRELATIIEEVIIKDQPRK